MANPITWQNIQNNGQGAANGAVNALDFAGRSFSNAFSGLQDVLKQREATDASNVVQERKNATQDFMNQMRQPNTVEGFQAQQAGFEQQRAALGNTINQSEATSYLDQRLRGLQADATANNAFNVSETARIEKPIEEQYKIASLRNDRPAMDAISSKYPNLANGSGLLTGDRVLRNEDVIRAEAVKDATRKQGAYEDDLRTSASSRATAKAQQEDLRERAAISRMEKEAKIEDRKSGKTASAVLDKRYAEFIKDGPLDAGNMDTAAGKAAFIKGVADLGVSDDQKNDMIYNIAKYYKDGIAVGQDDKGKPIKLPLPVSVAIDAVGESTDNPFSKIIPGWSRRGDVMTNIIDRRFGVDSNGKPLSKQEGTDAALISLMGAAAAMRNQRAAPLLPGSKPVTVINPVSK